MTADMHRVHPLTFWAATSSEFADFLLARISEDADKARAIRLHVSRKSGERLIAEADVKRRIVEEWVHMEGMIERGTYRRDVPIGYRAACRIMGTIYSDHPDYNEEWKP